jgi:hypothetical protein
MADAKVPATNTQKRERKTDRRRLDATGIDLSRDSSRENALLAAYKLKQEIKETTPVQEKLNPLLASPKAKSFLRVSGCKEVQLFQKSISPAKLRSMENDSNHELHRHRHHPAAYERLSSQEAFTTNYSNKIHHTHMKDYHSGDYCEDPLQVSKMLMNSSYADLTIPGRAADFSSTVEWRMQLRSNLN